MLVRSLRSCPLTQLLQPSSVRSPNLTLFLHSPISSKTSSALPSFPQNPPQNPNFNIPIPSKYNLAIPRSTNDQKSDDPFMKHSSLQDILKQYGHLSPHTTRRFWRVSELGPTDYLEILLGFRAGALNPIKVRFLWNLFIWCNERQKQRGEEFCHEIKSFEIMGSMLVRTRMVKEAELLVLEGEAKGVVFGDAWMFSEMIEGFVKEFRLENAVAVFHRARKRGLVLSGSCYKALLDGLIRMESDDLIVRVYADMLEFGLGSCSEDRFFEFVVRELCKSGKTLEAVYVLKKLKGSGVEPSSLALTELVEGYCKMRVYDDALNFLKEWSHVPEACICNKMVSSLGRNSGSEKAWKFVKSLENIGFQLDAVTFGILISRSCSERKLKNAFVYLSEGFSRGIKLDMHPYNALISGLFREGMYSGAKNIYEEMIDKGLKPGLSTFKILLCGYCKYRKFDEVKRIIGDMVNCGMTCLAPAEDAVSKAFQILGLDRLGVKVKRDNDLGLAKAEFFDSLGNGLYLETDIEEYDKTLEESLDIGVIPDFDSMILENCYKVNVQNALKVKDEAVQWGNALSLSAESKLIEVLCASSSYVKNVMALLDESPESYDQFSIGIYNLLIQYLSRNGMITRARLLLERSFVRQIPLESDTYTDLLLGFCKEKNIDALRESLQMAQRRSWLPGLSGIKELANFLFKFGMDEEALELFDNIMEKCQDSSSNSVITNAIVEELCCRGYTDVVYRLLGESLHRDHYVNIESYTSLITGFIKEKKSIKALEIMDILLKKNMFLSASVNHLVVPLLFKLKGIEKALSLKQDMLDAQSEPAILLYSALVNELCRIGNVKIAVCQLHEMQQSDVIPDCSTLNALIQGFCNVKSLRKALELLCVMLRTNIDLTISGFRSLVCQFCTHGRPFDALRLEEMLVKGSKTQSPVLQNILIFYLFRTGNSLLVEAILTHISPNSDTYNFLINGFSKCGDVKKSVRLLNTMISEGMKPNNRSLRTVICYLCSNGELHEALELSKVMECNGWKHGSVVLHALTEGLLQQGGVSMAEPFLTHMEENNMISDYIDLNLLIKKFIVHGNIKKAVDLLNVMLMNGSFPSENSYSLVINGLTVQRLFDEALDFHAEMLYRNIAPSLESCSALVCGLCDNGRTDDARKILGEMIHFGSMPTGTMYNYVIDKYYSQNNLNKASELLQEMQHVGYSPNFETYWALISNFSTPENKNDDNNGKGFLSRLLSSNDLSAKNGENGILSTFK